MGLSGSKNLKRQKKKNSQRNNETKIEVSPIHSIDLCLFEVCPSICKIIFPTEKGIKKITGFLVKLYKDNDPLFCLIISEHVIDKEIIEKKTKIEIFYFNEKKRIELTLNQNERFIHRYIDIDFDCTIIEILDQDQVNEDYFLVPNVDYDDKNYNELAETKKNKT